MAKSRNMALTLEGLRCAPSQVHGAVRLLPLLRDGECQPLRLYRRALEQFATVGLEGRRDDPSVAYFSYVPHAFVLETQGKNHVLASQGAQLARRRDDGLFPGRGRRLIHRMARCETETRLRFLPLHLALEGLLALHFGGPDHVWPEYARRVLSRGLSPRFEVAYTGRAVHGLDEALRTFEIHPNQCGVLVFVSDTFASAFVAPRPEDYRELHASLIENLYADLIVRYAAHASDVQASRVKLHAENARSFDDVARELELVSEEWARYEASLANGLFARELTAQEVSRVGPFALERFRSDMALGGENYVGERIVDAQGRLQYLKVFRLSEAQVRRAYLLMRLHENQWHLESTAVALGIPYRELIERLESAELGYILRDYVRWRRSRS